MSVMVKTWIAMDGESFAKALEEAVPELLAAEQAAQTQTGGPTAPGAGTPPPEGGGEPAADAQVQSALLRAQPSPSRQQVFVNNGR
jgi:hypothetical protein